MARNPIAQRQNFIRNSDNFSAATWLPIFGSITATGRPDPFGGTGAQTFTPSAAGSRLDHTAAQYTMIGGETYTASAWARVASGVGTATLQHRDDAFGSIGSLFTVTGTWQKCVTTFIALMPGNGVAFFQDIGGTQTPIDVYGAQLVRANWAGEPITTTGIVVDTGDIENITVQRQNLIKQSNTPSNAAWAKLSTTVAGQLVYPASSGNNRGIYQTNTTIIHSGFYTQYVIVKYSGIRWIALSNAIGSLTKVWFDVQNGVIGTQQPGYIGRMFPLADGYYLCSVTETLADPLIAGFACTFMILSDADNSITVTANGTDGVLWGGAGMVSANWTGELVETTSAIYNVGDIENINIQQQNIATYSDDLSNGIYTKGTHATVSYDAAVADPFGGTGAYKIIDDATTNLHYIRRSSIANVGAFSYYLKAGNITTSILSSDGNGITSINLSTGAISGGTLLNHTGGGQEWWSSEDVGGGWWKVMCVYVNVPRGTPAGISTLFGPGAGSYLGDGTGYIYMKRFQVTRYGTNWTGPTVMTAASIVDTGDLRNVMAQEQNLILQSEDLSSGSWIKVANTTITPNTDADQFGNMTLDTILGGAVNNQYVLQTFSGTLGRMYTIAAVVKAGTNTHCMLGDGQATNTQFLLTGAGSITGNQGATAPIAQSITALGGGLYKISLTLIPAVLRIILYNGWNDGTSNGTTIIAGRFQAVEANWEGPYAETTTAAVNMGSIRNMVE